MPPKAKKTNNSTGAKTCRLRIRPRVQKEYTTGDALPCDYVADEVIAHGGSGVVIKAHKPAIHPPIYKAIKVINADDNASSVDSRNIIQKEFYCEAEVSYEIGSDPYAIGVEDIMEMPDGTRALVFPYVTGHTLMNLNHAHIEKGLLLPFELTAFIAHRILSTLCHARERGIAHRDLCPNNVMIQRTGTPMLLDWGAGSNINDGILVGKPGYIAPEVIREPEKVDRKALYKADIFSLGAVMRELICGFNALDPQTDDPEYDPYAVIEERFKMNTDKLIPIHKICTDVPVALSEIVSACLCDNPDDRPVAEDLYEYMGSSYLYTAQVGFGPTAETLEHYLRFFYGAPPVDRPLPDDKTGRSLAKIIYSKYRRKAEEECYAGQTIKNIAVQEKAEFCCGNVYRSFENAFGAKQIEDLVYGLCRGALRNKYGRNEEIANDSKKAEAYNQARNLLDNMTSEEMQAYLKQYIAEAANASEPNTERIYLQQVFQQIRNIPQFQPGS